MLEIVFGEEGLKQLRGFMQEEGEMQAMERSKKAKQGDTRAIAQRPRETCDWYRTLRMDFAGVGARRKWSGWAQEQSYALRCSAGGVQWMHLVMQFAGPRLNVQILRPCAAQTA